MKLVCRPLAELSKGFCPEMTFKSFAEICIVHTLMGAARKVLKVLNIKNMAMSSPDSTMNIALDRVVRLGLVQWRVLSFSNPRSFIVRTLLVAPSYDLC